MIDYEKKKQSYFPKNPKNYKYDLFILKKCYELSQGFSSQQIVIIINYINNYSKQNQIIFTRKMIGKKKNDDYTKSNDTNKVIQNVYDLYIFYDNNLCCSLLS